MQLKLINDKVNSSIKKYKLPQAIRVVTSYLKQFYPKEDSKNLYKRVIFKANHSLAFQKSEIKEIYFIEVQKEIKVEITLNFLGIFGSSSPLPSHYSELILYNVDADKVLYDFLNLFNHHLQRFVYPIWEKHRYYIQYKNDLSDLFSKYILSFLGLYSHHKNPNSSLNLKKLIPYIGILSMKHKSVGTLKSILRHYLSHKDIDIIQCIPSKYQIPSWQHCSLGDSNMSLGSDFLIGESIVSKNSKFRILLKNATSDDLIKYSIHGNMMTELNNLVSFSLNEPLEHEVCLEIKKDEKKELLLYEDDERFLGVNCWIGDSTEDEQIIMAQKGK